MQKLIYKDIWQIIFIMALENCPALLQVRRGGYLPLLPYQPISRNVSGQNKKKAGKCNNLYLYFINIQSRLPFHVNRLLMILHGRMSCLKKEGPADKFKYRKNNLT